MVEQMPVSYTHLDVYKRQGVGTVVMMKGTDVTIAFDNQGLKTINKEYTTLDLL